MLVQFVIGVILSGLVSFIAYQRGALSQSGIIGAMLVGTAIFTLGGWVWGMVLIAFFVLSSLLSVYKADVKSGLAEKFTKGHRRDIWQTLANGGFGALVLLLYQFYPAPVMLAAFAGALATVNADTWATELGVLSKKTPRLITTGKEVETGTSGAVTALGTLAALLGGLAIGLAAWLFLVLDKLIGGPGYAQLGVMGVIGCACLIPVTALGGLVGALFDSLLGATVQAIYYSPTQQKETERKVDSDGTPSKLVRGWSWLNNDWVNFISSAVGALVGAVIWGLIH